MPVYMLYEMPYDEYRKWFAYFERRPYGWREDDRTMKIMQSFGTKAKPGEVFASLAMMSEQRTELLPDQVDSTNLKRSGFFSKLLTAKGGDAILGGI